METWLLLFILSVLTYFIVQRSVSKITRTPVWLIWLVMMTPIFIWSAWGLIYGTEKAMPFLLFVGPFVLCLLLYWWLIQIGRITPQKSENTTKSVPVSEDLNLEIPKTQPEPTKIRPITQTEEKALRDCFPWGVYYLQNIDYRPQAILCRGKLRSVPDEAYETIKENVERVFGDRFLVLFQESFQGQPFFALVSNPWAKNTDQSDVVPINRPFWALGLFLLTLFTTTVTGAGLSGILPEQWLENLRLLSQGLPYSLGIMAILGVRELSHYWVALHYQIRATLPYFIPFPSVDFLGTLGAFVQMRPPTPNRQALFDIAIAGSLGGFFITLPLLIWGLSLSEVAPLSDKSSILTFEALNPRFSFLFSLMGKLVLGSALVPGQGINLHPLAVAGYIGLIVTALNLMPVGQLDGGKIVHAMYGQKTAIIIGQLARLFMFILSMIQKETQPAYLIWAIFLLLMPITSQPALNDVTELDNKRDFWGLFSLILLLLILLPLPGAVAQWLNI